MRMQMPVQHLQKEFVADTLYCVHDKERQSIFRPHNRFYIGRDKETGLLFAQCIRCGSAFDLTVEIKK